MEKEICIIAMAIYDVDNNGLYRQEFFPDDKERAKELYSELLEEIKTGGNELHATIDEENKYHAADMIGNEYELESYTIVVTI